MKTGKHSVVIGNVSGHSDIGEGSVVIGATDANGNTIINTPMAVGYGAKAGLGSIAIGAFAGAGLPDLSFPPQLRTELEGIVELAIQQGNQPLIAAIEKLATELRQPEPKRGAILGAWEGVRSLAAINGAYNLLAQASTAITAYVTPFGA